MAFCLKKISEHCEETNPTDFCLVVRRLTIYILHIQLSAVVRCTKRIAFRYNFQRQFSVVSVCQVKYAVAANELTTNVDLQLTEVRLFIHARKLHNNVSVRRHFVGTLQVDRRPFSNHAWVLTADSVVPHSRCSDDG